MKELFTTKRLCRAGIIAALYVALTYAFMPVAFQGILQIRPAEALCILPLFFPEAVPALFVGCALSNLASPMLIYDVPIGSATTLVAALLTWLVGYLLRRRESAGAHVAKIALGGFFPVILNAILIPVLIVFIGQDVSAGNGVVSTAYWMNFASMCATEALWIYGLGAPLYYFVYRMQKKNVAAFLPGKKKPVEETQEQ